MTSPTKFLLTATLTLAVSTVASGCSLFDRSDPPSTPPGNGGGSLPTNGGGGGGGGGGGTVSPKTTSPKTTTSQRANGTVSARINGTDRISCDSIDSTITVTAQGKSQWNAVPRRSYKYADKLAAKGVTVSPSSGELESGKSVTVRVRGSYDKATPSFYVYVTYPTNIGDGATGLEFKCR